MATNDEAISDAQKQEFEESTSCCICTDTYKCPKLLPCGHTFCMDCIQKTGLKTNKGPGDEMPCPICRRNFNIPSNGFTALEHDYSTEVLIQLIRFPQILGPSVAAFFSCDACLEEQQEAGKDVQRADAYCSDCKQNLCEDCCRHHRKLKLTKNHNLLPINGQIPTEEDLTQILVPSVCDLHRQKDLEIYCFVCKTAVCSICFFENHESHKGTHVTKAAAEFRKVIANHIEAVNSCINQAEVKKLEITKSKQDVHEKCGSMECDIIRKRDGVKQAADEEAMERLEELSSAKHTIIKEIDIEADNIDAQLATLRSYNSYCEKMLTEGSPGDICLSVGNLSTRVNELQAESQYLIARQLKPVSLCFTETESEEGDERNITGQLREQVHSKQETKAKQHVIEELKKDIKTLKDELRANEAENEILKLTNERLRQNLENELLANSSSKQKQELYNEKLINQTIEAHIDKPGEHIKLTTISSTAVDKQSRLELINSEMRDDLKKEGSSKNGRFLDNAKLGVKFPVMATSNYMYVEHRENLESPATCSETTSSPVLQENKINNSDPDRINALATLPSIHIDEDIFYYLVRNFNQELTRISQKCEVFEPYKVGQGHKLAFEVKPQYDTDSVMAEFRQLYGTKTVGQVDIPKGVDPESLKSLVEAMTEFKDVELRFVSEKRVCKIVGSYLAMQSAKKRLIDVIAANTYDTNASTANRKTQPNVRIPTTPKVNDQRGSYQWHSATNSNVVYGHQSRRSKFRILNESRDSVIFSDSNSLTIEVKRDDLTRIHDVDVVVSCINKQLDIDGQLSDEIMKVAGPYVKTELLSHKQRQTFLSPGCLVHTSAGGLPGVKVIIHAVRPQVHDFPPNDPNSSDVLRRLFTNCLCYTNNELRLKSIGLPPIGFSLYGAQMVVKCFLQAVETFASIVSNGNPSAAAQHQPNHPHHLTYIQLIANDHQCIGQLIQCIIQRVWV